MDTAKALPRGKFVVINIFIITKNTKNKRIMYLIQ